MASSHAARVEYKDLARLAPDVDEALRALGNKAAAFGIEKDLLELIKIRASQINGCAFCVQFHVMQSERLKIASDKLHMIAVWRDAPIFSDRERAALAWTEALTLMPQGAPDDVYAQATAAFSEQELLYLTSAVVGINAWNRFGAAYRWTPPTRAPTPMEKAG